MCGICGVLHLDGAPVNAAVVAAMTAALVHRGPDQGAVVAAGRVGLGNRRLAIQDVSAAGALPMRAGDLTLAFNGEIYNHPDLRREMEARGERYRSDSDAETILMLYRAYDGDLARVLARLQGMFALALWDDGRRRLILARDRMGEKPLYYYAGGGKLAFASEIKALLLHPDVPRRSIFAGEGGGAALRAYLRHGWAESFVGIVALPPGTALALDADRPPSDVTALITPYYHLPMPADAGQVTAAQAADWREHVIEALSQSVRGCLISDVPLGAFLSGGLDSSMIAALMCRHSTAAVKTFSIGFAGDTSYDETAHAKRAAAYLGTEHTALIVEPQSLDLLPKLVWHHDQPFADSSAIPTYLVSRLARQQVTVALTGDGGDELFAGYERFYAAALAARMQRIIPRPLWRWGGAALAALPQGTSYYDPIKRAGRFVEGASGRVGAAYAGWVSVFGADWIERLMARPNGGDPDIDAPGDTLPQIVRYNMATYLPFDLLVKTDRCSMAASLEARAPFLDHRLAALAAQMPMNLKLKGRTTKYILKEAARGGTSFGRLLPDAIIDRPKHGFGVPLGAWLRRDIETARAVLLSAEAGGRGLLKLDAVAALLTEHASGKRDHSGRLWALLTLEWWHRLFIDPAQIAPPTQGSK